jgi:hypothetical protein
MRRVEAVLLSVILVPVLGMAQSSQSNWDSLKQLGPGEKIEVVARSVESLRGPFVSVSEEAITLRVGKSQESINRAQVVRVSIRDTLHRTRNMLIGVAVGVGAGLALTIPLEIQQSNEGNSIAGKMAGLTAVLGGAGLGLGAIPGNRTIYRVKK